jgi:hypothetical protein
MVKACAIALIALSGVHMLVLGADALAYVPGWVRLDLWTLAHWTPLAHQPSEIALSGAAFWSTLGSFAVPAAILGGLILHMAMHGQRVPVAIGWALFAWLIAASAVVEPSGFPAGVAIAGLLLVALYRQPAV